MATSDFSGLVGDGAPIDAAATLASVTEVAFVRADDMPEGWRDEYRFSTTRDGLSVRIAIVGGCSVFGSLLPREVNALRARLVELTEVVAAVRNQT